MDLPAILAIEGLGIIFIVSIIFWAIFSKFRTNKIFRNNSPYWPLPRLNINYENIASLYRDLNEDLKKRREIPPAAEWLLDNFYIIEEQVKCIRKDLNKKNYSRLPVLQAGPHKGHARIYTVIMDLVSQTDGQLDESTILKYLTDYQSQNTLFDREIWAIPITVQLCLLESMKHICENIKETQEQWDKADEIADNWLSESNFDLEKVMKLFESNIEGKHGINASFAEHMSYLLRRSERNCAPALEFIHETLSRLGTTIEIITQKEHHAQSIYAISMANNISSLKLVFGLDWTELFVAVSHIDQILRKDPAGIYPQMDLVTRNYYRSQIEEIALTYGISEFQVAEEAVRLAQRALKSMNEIDPVQKNNPQEVRKYHIGYYLLGKGRDILLAKHGGKRYPFSRPAIVVKRHPHLFYIGFSSLFVILLVFVAVEYLFLAAYPQSPLNYLIAALAVLLPATEISVNIINWIICKSLAPALIPRLELKNGIPENLSTFVVIPALLPDLKRIEELLKKLENHYLSNRENNLYFALIGAFKDSTEPAINDDEKIVKAALTGIRELNRKYADQGKEKFFFFHRKSRYNKANNKWIGWERKRGALLEFNDLVLGSKNTSFLHSSSSTPPFANIKYVITLDSDTLLPIGTARKLIGAMAHPLNTPVIDKQRGIVIEGYGIMQPGIDFDGESSNKSLFSRIFTGQSGIDPYANAVSNVYQDLFAEGIYTGKGIYDLKAFQGILRDAIPENSVLSHDLLEGSYVRTALVTDTKLIDSYPSNYNAYSARLHRWVRGDWQLVPFLGTKILDVNHNKIANPLSFLSKWKMLDNLRRSLIPPALVLLVALSFTILPGNMIFWLSYLTISLFIPFIIAVIDYAFSGFFFKYRVKRYIPVVSGLKASLLQVLLTFIFLPYQAFLMLRAIFITLSRVFITKKNLLEWVTQADIEKNSQNTIWFFLSEMFSSIWIPVIIAALAFVYRPEIFYVSLCFLAVWAIAPLIACKISLDLKESPYTLSREDLDVMGVTARRTWRYFEDFVNITNNYLAPDNYQVHPPKGIAHRTSPTDIGLGLMATLAARDLGYLCTSRMFYDLDKTITTIEKLEKWNGHLYNWYDTHTLEPLRPAYVSSVDSGNLVGYLITLKEGLTEYLSRPVIEDNIINGIHDTLYTCGDEGNKLFESLEMADYYPGKGNCGALLIYRLLKEISDENLMQKICKPFWREKFRKMIYSAKIEIENFLPGLLFLDKIPENFFNNILDNIEIKTEIKELAGILKKNLSFRDLPGNYTNALELINNLLAEEFIAEEAQNSEIKVWLSELRAALSKSLAAAEMFLKQSDKLIARVDALSRSPRFSLLFDGKKQLFSIGFDLEQNKLSNSYYDLFASEARQTSYIAIARSEIPPGHWQRMGRALIVVDRYKGLVSWTGTMFEYLMPLLIMKTYKNTLLDETYSFVIRSQKKYAKQRNMPWGFSESAFHSLDINLNYHYKAIGVPWLGLKRGLLEDETAAPYATFLALQVAPEEALQNLEYLKKEGAFASYGYYEAVDYTPERLIYNTKRAVVKSFMAHHQGMSFVALDNFFNGNIMQERFHADPEMKAAELLLQEKIPANIVFSKETTERVVPFKGETYKKVSSLRTFHLPDPVLPKAHMLSNGNYSVMLTDRGTGFSTNESYALTRWREDISLDTYGTFFFIRDVDANALWSATHAPLNILPEDYQVSFTADKAKYSRLDGQILTETEIIVTSEDNAEIRTLSFHNMGIIPRTLEITSYFEVVIASLASDIAHPAFSKLFVKTEFDSGANCLIAQRRPRSENDKTLWFGSSAIEKGKKNIDLQYETDRLQMIGRGKCLRTPLLLERGKQLTNTVGSVLDPVMCLRLRVTVEPRDTARIAFITAVSENRESLLSTIGKYSSYEAVAGAFRLALTRSQVETKYLNINNKEMELYQNMISHILFNSPLRSLRQDSLKSGKGQAALWVYGISGDLPIVLLVMRNSEDVKILYEILAAHEYWRIKDLNVDLVILSEEENSYLLPLFSLVSEIVSAAQKYFPLDIEGKIHILDKNKVADEDVALLYTISRIVLANDGGTLSDQMSAQKVLPLPLPRIWKASPKAYPRLSPAHLELKHFNGWGGFSPDAGEYVIQLEQDQYTPAPWINVIANQKFGFLVSESGGGYSWSENSHENKLSTWSNDPVCDDSGEVIYICDTDTGEVWTVTALPVREDETYVIRHGFGYSVFEHTSHGIGQQQVQFVPLAEMVKVSIIRLTNHSDETRNLTLTYYMRPVLGVTDQETAMHIKTSRSKTGAILAENPYNEEFPGKVCILDVSIEDRSITGDRKEFFGSGDLSSPESLQRVNLSGTTGAGFDPCAALQVKLTLNPNASEQIVFVLGMAENQEAAEISAGKYIDAANALQALEVVQDFWQKKLSLVKIHTPVDSMDYIMNGWLQYQVMSCRLWARSAFYQSGGAFGFRDQLQDSLSLAHICPEITRAQILLHAKHQFVEGDVQHWWNEPTGRGIRTRFSDDLLWLPYVTAEYIRISGDMAILEERLPYLEDDLLKSDETEKFGKPSVSEIDGTLYDHCLKAIEKSLSFGQHGLPLMGSGDWNDSMNTVGNKGRGESVWLAWFMISVLDKFSFLCRQKGEEERASNYEEIKRKIAAAIEQNAWDGSWYRRAYFDDGRPLGSIQNSECKIDAIAQAWSVISGAGNPERASLAMNSLENYLVQWEDGLIKLLTPAFDKGDLKPGYIKGYLPGVRENGGQYSHAAVWVVIAYALLGDGDKAGQLFELLNPVNHTRSQKECLQYKVEPYVMPADVYALQPSAGRGGWTWYTGSAGWMYRAGLEYTLGFQKNGNSVIMNPCIPKKWTEYSIEYQYINTMYSIKIKNPERINKGVKYISVDGKIYNGNVIHLVNDGKNHNVEVIMGI